ncbi:MAG: hypothetical protein ACLRJV_14485 [Eubacteriales bacterium]
MMNSPIASLGAVAAAVSRKTDYLVCGEKAGRNCQGNRSWGIRVLTPNEFSIWLVWLKENRSK